MRRPRRAGSWIALAILTGCGGSAPPPSETTTAAEAAIRDLIARTEAANNAADTLAWVDLFEPGAVYMPPGAPAITTRAGLEEIAAAGFGPNAADISIEPEEIVVAGDWAFARNEVRGEVTSRADGTVYPVDVKQLVVYHRQADGTWKIARFIGNANG